MTKRIRLRHSAAVEALAIFARREMKLLFKNAAQVDAGPKPAFFGNDLKRIRGLLQKLSCGGQARFGDITGRRYTDVTREHAGEIARTHGDPFGQPFDAQICGEVLQDQLCSSLTGPVAPDCSSL